MGQLPKDLVSVIDNIIPVRISESLIQAELIAAGGPLVDSPNETKKRFQELEKFLSLLSKDPETVAILEDLQKKIEAYTSAATTAPRTPSVPGVIKGKILNISKDN